MLLKEHLATSGDIFGCHHVGCAYWLETRRMQNMLPGTGQSPPMMNYRVQNACGTAVEMSGSTMYDTGSHAEQHG